MKTKRQKKLMMWAETTQTRQLLMHRCKTLIRKVAKEVTPGCPSHQFKDSNSVLPVPLSRIAHRGIGHRSMRIAYSFLACAMRKWRSLETNFTHWPELPFVHLEYFINPRYYSTMKIFIYLFSVMTSCKCQWSVGHITYIEVWARRD